jgi:hypothetical protein
MPEGIVSCLLGVLDQGMQITKRYARFVLDLHSINTQRAQSGPSRQNHITAELSLTMIIDDNTKTQPDE